MTPDVNVLVAASRSDHPHHPVAHAWIEQALTAAETGASFTVLPMVLASFLRLVTHPKIFQYPTPTQMAVEFIDALLAAPGVRLASSGPEWPLLRQLCLDGRLSANQIPDACLAAATVHLGEHLVSFDKDFSSLLGRAQFTLLKP